MVEDVAEDNVGKEDIEVGYRVEEGTAVDRVEAG